MQTGLSLGERHFLASTPSAYVAARFDTRPLRILIVTDAWTPQVNGVVRTLQSLQAELIALGHTVRFVTPEHRTTLPLPTYPEIRVALYPRYAILRDIGDFQPDAIHIATEGPMGFFARVICLERNLSFTTAFHTRFPDYICARFPLISESVVFSLLRKFHSAASATLIATPSLMADLAGRDFANLRLWSRGVDTENFHPCHRSTVPEECADLPRPFFLYVGRVAVEKNIEAFLSLDLPGTKLVAGEGPAKTRLQALYPAVRFIGHKTGAALARLYANADVFVFPSLTDTFGLVILEALSSGTPVAAFPVTGPNDILAGTKAGVLGGDLRKSCLAALALPRSLARERALQYSWRASARQFASHLVPAEPEAEPWTRLKTLPAA